MNRRRSALALGAALTALLPVLAGCGADGKADAGPDASRVVDADAPTPTCANVATAHPLPSGFPGDFPLPPGTVVIGSEERSDGRRIVYGVAPEDVKAVLGSLQKALPAAGYALKDGEVEERDAESDWEGNGYRGRWEIRELPGCTNNTTVTVLAQKTG